MSQSPPPSPETPPSGDPTVPAVQAQKPGGAARLFSAQSLWRLMWPVRLGALVVALLMGPGLLGAVRSPIGTADALRAEQHYTAIRAHLTNPGDYGGLWGLPVPGWQVVALSQMASGLMSMAVDARQSGDEERLTEIGLLMAQVVERMLETDHSPYDVPLEDVEDFNDWGFYLGHVSLALGCHRYVTGASEYDALHRRIVRYQLARMDADGDHHARSYPNSYKWPADQALTLAAIHLYDRIHGTRLSVQPIESWLAAVEQRSVDGLPPLTLTDNSALPVLPDGSFLPPLDSAAIPRGSAISPTLFYMTQFAPDAAAALYAQYRVARWEHHLGMGGFREWPAGKRGWDLEGGPVVWGLGSLATIQGLAPARLFSDTAAFASINRSAMVAGIPLTWNGRRSFLLAPVLVEAWLFNGMTARPWFEPPPELPQSFTDIPAPIGAWMLLTMNVLLLVLVWLPKAVWVHLWNMRRA